MKRKAIAINILRLWLIAVYSIFQTCQDVSFLLRVLNLGVSAWEMISNQHFTEVALVSFYDTFFYFMFSQSSGNLHGLALVLFNYAQSIKSFNIPLPWAIYGHMTIIFAQRWEIWTLPGWLGNLNWKCQVFAAGY